MDLQDATEPGIDVERATELDPEKIELPDPIPAKSSVSAAFWMVVNTLATIGIVCFVIPFLPIVLACHTVH
jgi:ubiquitin C-terminal hydrolase